jgi:hypothetical protein
LIYGVLVVRILNKGSFDGSHGTDLVFSSFVDCIWLGFKKPETYFAVTAYIIGVHTLYRRILQHACRLALSAGTAFIGIYLPGIDITASAIPAQANDPAYGHKRGTAKCIPQKFSTALLFVKIAVHTKPRYKFHLQIFS